MAYIVISLIAAVISISVDKDSFGMVSADTPLIILSQIQYTIPFVALMSLCSVIVGSEELSALVGISIYVVIPIIINIVGIKMTNVADIISYTIPNATKPLYLQLSCSSLLSAALAVPVYVLIYGYLGWIVFSKRDNNRSCWPKWSGKNHSILTLMWFFKTNKRQHKN